MYILPRNLDQDCYSFLKASAWTHGEMSHNKGPLGVRRRGESNPFEDQLLPFEANPT